MAATKIAKTVNKVNSAAYSLNEHEALVTGVLTCFFNEPKQYGDTSDSLVKSARKVIETDPDFVARLACYARNEFHMRTISQVLAAEVAHGAKGSKVVRPMIRKVIERPDDITNILAYHFDTWGARTPRKNAHGKSIPSTNPVPRSLRRGIADIFGKFTEYHLAKYKGEGGLVKLRDALLIARPKPKTPEQGLLWKRLIEGKLATPETRETILSEQGQSKKVWEDFIDSGKMGYFAMVRNLNNFMKHGISDAHWAKVVARLTDPKAVASSKLVPFEFYKAYKMLTDNNSSHKNFREVSAALEFAMGESSKNFPMLPGTTFMTADESGSMQTKLSEKSMLSYKEVGNLLMATTKGFCEDAIVTVFGDTTAEVDLSGTSGILDRMKKIDHVGDKVGMSTMLHTAIAHLNKSGKKVDRIIVFSDMQAYSASLGFRSNAEGDVQKELTAYRKNINPDVWVHSIDLAGHGTIQFKGPKVNLISGWSDKCLEFIRLAETSDGSLIDTIRNYQI